MAKPFLVSSSMQFFSKIISCHPLASHCLEAEEGHLMLNESMMYLAISLAEKSKGETRPNPLVGAVIVKNGQIIGQGYHKKAGRPHAEREALANCTESPQGGTLYVTLTPCCHHGRTPPCTDAIIQGGIAHVVIGSSDPNVLVGEKSIAILKDAGILVTEGFCKEACDNLNPIFFYYITHKMPYITLKYAMTADGKIATKTGASRWISGEASRNHAHSLRREHAAILVGIGTVLADDPLLNCRLVGAVQPLRIVCDSNLRIPESSQICQSAGIYPTIIAYTKGASEKVERLKKLGLTLWQLPEAHTHVSLIHLFRRLGVEGIDSVLVEGGGQMHYSVLASGLAQQLMIYLAPKIFGGENVKTPVAGLGISQPDDAFALDLRSYAQLGDDILLTYTIGFSGRR